MRIVAVSDVSIGYGTPQLPLLTESLREHYGGQAIVIEPAQPELAPRHAAYPGFDFRRVATAEHPHSSVGRAEYVLRAARIVNDLTPDVLALCCTYTLPVVYKLKQRPRKVLYYSVESISFYGPFDIEMNRRAEGRLDVVLFPEENRAALEVGRCGFDGAPKVVLYNVSNRAGSWRDPLRRERNGRILYAGTISCAQTFADYYFSERVQNHAIDLYGTLKGAEERRRIQYLRGGVRYRGVVPASELAALRPDYCYSIVAWNPNVENQLYAAPNKFFESIADGVPPIAAPHPQCKLIIERYGCGLLMADWSYDAFVEALRKAAEWRDGPRWREMVEGCRCAVEAELNWDAQFEKVKAHLA